MVQTPPYDGMFDDSGSESNSGADSGDESESGSETESQTPHKIRKRFWTSIIRDDILEKALKKLDKLLKLKNPTMRKLQHRNELEAVRNNKENQYRADIIRCVEDKTIPFIHFVLGRAASSIDLPTTLFILKLILESDPDQICSHHEEPLLHKAIRVEVQSPVDFRGLTSKICTLVDPQKISTAIAQINNLKENCLHLIVRHQTYDAESIIASVDPQFAPEVFGQTRISTSSEDENGNTPLHDALNFEKVALRVILCPKSIQSTEPGLGMCADCYSATAKNKTLPGPNTYWNTLIRPLVNGCRDVLKQRNAAGQSPYAFHLKTRTRSVEALLKEAQGKAAPADLGAPRIINSKTSNDTEKARDSPEIHMSYDLQASNDIINQLESYIGDSNWGYEDMLLCFFSDNNDKKKNGKNRGTRPGSLFLRPGTRVSQRTPESYNFLKFESRLALVSLSLRPDDSYMKVRTDMERYELAVSDAENITDVFKWLRGKKGVTKILKVVVKDNPHRYCSEETIETCLECLDEIRFLDWDRPDLSAPTLSKAKGLMEVSLYSSGTNAVLYHWSDQNGLITLPKLRKVYLEADKIIHAPQGTKMLDGSSNTPIRVPAVWGLESPKRNKENIEKFKERLSLQGRLIEVVDVAARMAGSTSASVGKYRHHGNLPIQNKHAGFEAAVQFAQRLKKAIRPSYTRTDRKVRVALLDDGVNPEHEGIGHYLACDGFPESNLDGSDDPWYTSTCGHGSTMASIISALCPFVEIHVAKIDCHNQGYLQNPKFEVEKAAEAVEWAVINDMDIICMSWIVKVTNNTRVDADRIKTAIDADREGTMVYCAARDNNGNDMNDTAYHPADCKESRSIGAANSYNMPQQYVVTKKTDFLFPSENVLPNPIDGHSDGGNSVATAVATGVAALVLHCLWEDKISLDQDQRKPLMDTLFWKLIGSETSTTKYVNLAELFACSNGETPTPRRLVDRVLLKLGLERSEVETTKLRVPPQDKDRFHSYHF